jgi:flagellar basal-body rod modification protein FlgD
MNTTATKKEPTKTDPNSSLGQDAFLKLLVAQLKYQDPLNPADGADFMAQTAQFTMVEKLAAMQKQGETTISSQKQLQAIQLVGKQVSYTDTAGVAKDGIVESVRFTPEGQTLTINGTIINLSSVTGVTRDPATLTPTDGLSGISSTLSASVAAAIRDALSSTNVTSTATTAPAAVTPVASTTTATTVESEAATTTTTTTTSPAGAPATEPSPSAGTSESSAPTVSDTAGEKG